MDELELPPDDPGCRHAWHLYVLRLNLHQLNIDRREFIRQLRMKGICASVHFIPIPFLHFYSRLRLPEELCPRARELYPRIVSLPLYPAMTEEQVHYVASTVQEIVKSSRRARWVA
jgi:dTDP-4-amino-4,6-dideoxygalactose transaminase